MLRSFFHHIGAAILLAFLIVTAICCSDPLFAAPGISRPSPYLFEGSTVVRVMCVNAKSQLSWGTAFYLGSGLYMTANHVTEGAKCTIGKHAVTVHSHSPKPDYAIIGAAYYPLYHVNWDCDRLTPGKTYISTGYAGTDGEAIAQTLVVSTGISNPSDHTAEVNGSIVEGMSGGPVADMVGAVHAINTWHEAEGAPSGGVTEIADTPLCRGVK